MRAFRDLSGQQEFRIDDRFEATLRASGGDETGPGISLLFVAFVDTNTLNAVVPSGVAIGAYDLTVTGPFGLSGSLTQAYTVRERLPECVSDPDCPNRAPICGANRTCGACAESAQCRARDPLAPLCQPGTGACVACLGAMDCWNPTPICGAAATCVACADDDACRARDPAAPRCRTDDGACVACLISPDCGRMAPICSAEDTCGPCSADDECRARDPAAPRCQAVGGACVACRDSTDCERAAPICDGAGACGACATDDQCRGRDAAVPRCDLSSGACAECLEASHCGDANPCTTDECATGSCTHANNADPCDDGDACTVDDACADGFCRAGSLRECDDGNPCTDDSCAPLLGCVRSPNSRSCDDGNRCTMNDACAAAACQGAPLDGDGDRYVDRLCGGNDCDDGDPFVNAGVFEGPNGSAICTDGIDNNCNTLTDSDDPGCRRCADDSECADGNACNGVERCVAEACQAGTTLSCNDDNACTNDDCDPATGCTHENNTLACDDKDDCTVGDACSAATCLPGGPADCDDHNLCTDDSCDPSGGCLHPDNNALCDDGNPCTAGESCAGGACQPGPALPDRSACAGSAGVCCSGVCQTGTCCADLDCADTNPCTDDRCASNSCAHTDNAAACDDGNECTGADACSAGVCGPGAPLADLAACPSGGGICCAGACSPGASCCTDANCDDLEECTADACAAGACTHTSALDASSCALGSGICCSGVCQAGWACCANSDCDDGLECTAETCTAGVCSFPAAADMTACAAGAGACCAGACLLGNCCNHANCQNPMPICGATNSCTPCAADAECFARDPAMPRCSGGSCLGVGQCTGRLFATDKIQPGESISLTVADCDLVCAGSITVSVRDQGGEQDRVSLIEEPPCSGRFSGLMSTGAACPAGDNDGCLQAALGDVATTSYQDAADGGGLPRTVTAATSVQDLPSAGDLSTSTKTVFDLDGGEINPGDRLVICIRATNSSATEDADPVVIEDLVPAGLTYLPGPSFGCPLDNTGAPRLRWDCGDIGAGNSFLACFEATVDQLKPGEASRTIVNVAAVTAADTGSSEPFAVIQVAGPQCDSDTDCGVDRLCDQRTGTCLDPSWILFVDCAAACPGAGTSASPFCTIQSAVVSASADHRFILVRPGTCNEAVTVDTKDLLIAGWDGSQRPVLSYSACEGLQINSGSTVVIRRMELRAGVGVHSDSRADLEDNRIGPSICVGISCTNGADCRIDKNTIIQNTMGGIDLTGAAFTLTNNFIVRNGTGGGSGTPWGGVQISSPLVGSSFTNNTVAENSVKGNLVAGAQCRAPFILRNSILWKNAGAGEPEVSTSCIVHYSDIDQNNFATLGIGNIKQDPRFVDPGKQDFHIKADSNCINVADPAGVPPAPPDDVDREIRPMGARVDMGADEAL